MGSVLLIAFAVTWYATVVQTYVPKWGAEAEREWDAEIRAAALGLAQSFASSTDGSTVAVKLPPAPAPRAIEIPLLGRIAPAQPSGALAFDPTCAGLGANHTVTGGGRVVDLSTAKSGCLILHGSDAYRPRASYRSEAGGVLRTERGAGVALAGPPLSIRVGSGGSIDVTLGIVTLRGPSAYASGEVAGSGATMVGRPSVLASSSVPNAASVGLELVTAYPDAWRDWFEESLQAAGLVASRAPGPGVSTSDFRISCAPSDCVAGPDGTGSVRVLIEGPRTDRDDIKFVVTQVVFDVSVR